jgi:fucose 4-O-acetylase-like acetyltransferase
MNISPEKERLKQKISQVLYEKKLLKQEISEALYWIRGIAISLVVIGHVIGFDQNYGMRQLYNSELGIIGAIGNGINTIHMTTFFIVSGIATAIFSRPSSSFKQFFTNKVARLLIPIFCWAPPFFIFQSLVKGREISLTSILNSVIQPYEIFWFLHALIFAVTFHYLAEKLRISNAIYFGISVLLTFASLQKLQWLEIVDLYLYWNGFFALGIVSIGWIYNFELSIRKKTTFGLGLIASLLLVIVGMISFLLPITEYQGITRLINSCPGFLLFYIAYHIFERLCNSQIQKAIHYIGSMSLIVYLFHSYFTRFSSILISSSLGQISPIAYLLILSIAGITVPLLLNHFILKNNKFLSYVTGGK